MKPVRCKAILFLIFPQLRFAKFSFNVLKFLYNFKTHKKTNRHKMQLPIKLAIGSLSALIFMILVGFVIFPNFLTSKVKSMVNLKPGTDLREMFLKVPFALTFKIYIFNVTNPMEVQEGKKPIVKEVGPFCYEEWKDKLDVKDGDNNDTISYNARDTFLKARWPGCWTGEEEITIPHPMILGLVNTVAQVKPGALSLVNKAIKSIYSNPTSIFITAKANDILFDGLPINCNVADFAGKAICSQLLAAPSLKHINETELSFSFLGMKNATPGKRIEAYRGKKDFHNVGKITLYDDAAKMDVWPTDECNAILGTDGTIFPPFLTPEEGIISFSADLCRSLVASFVRKTKYDGIPVSEYTATLGDMSKNENEKCYCITPETCMKRGMMNLFKCSGVPLYASLPHFYDCDESYLEKVEGLSPNKSKHEIIILFEPTTGSPLYAKKRMQFSMPVHPIPKVDLFKNLSETILPLFWLEEGVELNSTFSKPLKDLFAIKKVVKISSWLVILASLGGLAASGYMFYRNNGTAEITSVSEAKSSSGRSYGISTVHENGLRGQVNHAMSDNEINKY